MAKVIRILQNLFHSLLVCSYMEERQIPSDISISILYIWSHITSATPHHIACLFSGQKDLVVLPWKSWFHVGRGWGYWLELGLLQNKISRFGSTVLIFFRWSVVDYVITCYLFFKCMISRAVVLHILNHYLYFFVHSLLNSIYILDQIT